eukprot:NODE_884_length_3465_cov_0.227867.p1 type:complete len:512 gc:universal NODE_884_length_3465_cov_0.227867:3312-1777(-)
MPEKLLHSLNLDQYLPAFKENEIEDSSLEHLDHELLKDIGVVSVGHRILILDQINKPDELKILQEQLDKLKKDLEPLFKMVNDLNAFLKRSKKKVAIKVYQENNLKSSRPVVFESFRICADDTCSKILPDALNKYKITDDWQNYALFIVCGINEKCLGYDEKPLSVYNQLKDKGENPMFVLKHIKQVQSPQGKHQKSDKLDIVSASAAVVIYEYISQREDELTISIGDRVYIQQKSQGWYVVSIGSNQGWVPSGCLLEDPDNDIYNSTVATGIASFDYQKVGPNEISMRNGDVVHIKKKYQHWLYVKVNEDIGFVPLCYVNLEIRGRSSSRVNTPTSAQAINNKNLESPSKFGSILDLMDEDRAKDIFSDINDILSELQDKLGELPAPNDNNKKIFNDVRRKSRHKAIETMQLLDTVQENMSGVASRSMDDLYEMLQKLEKIAQKPQPTRDDDNIRRLTEYQQNIDNLYVLMLEIVKSLNLAEDQRPSSRYMSNSRRIRSPVSNSRLKKKS